jgi:hypothetical protein
MKTALVIGTKFATNNFHNGGSKRIMTVSSILETLDYEVRIISVDDYMSTKLGLQDVIVVVSFASAKSLCKAKAESKFLWFDPTDSWKTSRLSRIRKGEFKQFAGLIRDIFYLQKKIKVDLITFISRRDLNREFQFVKATAMQALIVPNKLEEFQMTKSFYRRILFVGDGKYGPNRQAEFFLSRVADHLPQGMRIQVIGAGYKNRYPKLDYLGEVSNEDLYHSDDIHIAPIFSGAGIKNKVLEPLSLGLNVITSIEGASGLVRSQNLFICKKPSEFAWSIIEIMNSEMKQEPVSDSIFLDDNTLEVFELLNL